MKNKIILLLFLISFQPLMAESLKIQSKSISIDKNTKFTIFEGDVNASDLRNNVLVTEYAEYSKDLQFLESKGKTTIVTSEGYEIVGKNMSFDNINNLIKSNYPAVVNDLENNNIFLEKFEYKTDQKFFKSTENVKVIDSKNNTYNFSQVYIDEIKREIIGTDIKAFFNDANFKSNKNNKPRIFANTVKMDSQGNKFTKSNFTLCDYREQDKCPPWSLQASKMTHDKIKKTIYYDNAVIKIYDLPVFYTPKFSHPDPTVDRRSGFLAPVFTDSKNLGSGFALPYFFNINKDKDFTLTPRMYASEHPLFLGEYRHAFNESDLILDFGYTEGYNNTSYKKQPGNKTHFFTKFVKNFKGKDNSDNNLQISMQKVSNDKYLKLYKIDTNLADHSLDTLENTINFTHEKDDLFLGIKASAFETLKNEYEDKYEYILPDLIIDKNLISNKIVGTIDLQSNIKVHSYDTNKTTKFLINDIDWKYKDLNFKTGLTGKILGKLKNVNYEAQNVTGFKNDPTNELFGALGYLTDVNFEKNHDETSHLLTPKILFRYAPGNTRNEISKTRLNYNNIFSLDRLNAFNNFETGVSATLGFDYNLKNNKSEFNFSGGQVVNQKENKNMPSSSSLDEKLSDFVGGSSLKINKNVNLSYNFSLDQNYKNLNYNEFGTNFDFDPIKLNFGYLKEKEHIGNQEYVKSSLEYQKSEDGIFTAGTKRNLVTNSAEYYDLSYEYINDCLRAGLVYRREFYNDSELEPENSLMFKISLVPFSNLSSPAFN